MKKVAQPYIRKVYGQTNQQSTDIQMNTVRKINSLLSSGAVSVTGPAQPRILKQQQTKGTTNVVSQIGSPITHQQQKQECYVCGDVTILNNAAVLAETLTNVSNTKLPNKIGRVVGDKFMVIISVEDVICKRCLSMFNHMDRLENDLERIKTNILNLINKKYGIADGEITAVGTTVTTPAVTTSVTKYITSTVNTSSSSGNQPMPAKLQRLAPNIQQLQQVNRKNSNNADNGDGFGEEIATVTRKVAIPTLQAIHQQVRDPLENQLTTMFESATENSTITTTGTTVNIQQKVQQQQQIHQPPQIRQNTTAITPTVVVQQQQQPQQQQQQHILPQMKKQPIKIYKCMSCDFKTTDLKHFQPHYETCKQQNGHRCKHCKKLFTNANALKAHTAEKHSAEYTCSICSINFQSEITFKKHMETNHPDVKTIESSAAVAVIYTCTMCSYKTPDKQNYDEHLRKHIKVKPFKCRICSMRFESRDQAAIHAKAHQPDYFKCGKCAMSFPQRDLLVKHFETHKQQVQQQTPQQQPTTTIITQPQHLQQQTQLSTQDLTTQKLLQETIDEALRDTGELDSKIHFFSCNICSLTFIQENYYNQHMEAHKRESSKKIMVSSSSSTPLLAAGGSGTASTGTTTTTTTGSQSLIRQDVRNTNATILHAQPNAISDADIESMFEKMHSDKAETEGNSNSSENLVITKQENSVGGITFNITIPQQTGIDHQLQQETKTTVKQETQIGIDMPVLDQDGEQQQQHQQELQIKQYQVQSSSGGSGPVSMPSLDDDGDSSQPSNTEQIPMDLEDIQNAAGEGQIKFILNEDGQILQLDNHIITTDDEGNQILVQGTDSEQIQQLLQSVGVLHAGDGDGETYQMIQGENNQMIIVQGDNNEAQIIDASMLNEDGHLVIQQHGGEDGEEMHIINEDGVQVPVTIAFQQQLQQQPQQQDEGQSVVAVAAVADDSNVSSGDGGGNGNSNASGDQSLQQHEDSGNKIKMEIGEPASTTARVINVKSDDGSVDSNSGVGDETTEAMDQQEQQSTPAHQTITTAVTTEATSTTPVTSTTGEVFFNLEDLMQQSERK